MKVILVAVLCVALAHGHQINSGPAISNQHSVAHTGEDGTAIGHGTSSAKGNGAIANQNSVATGLDGSTVVADGSADATSVGGGHLRGGNAEEYLNKFGLQGGGIGGIHGGKPLFHHGGVGSPAISNQHSKAVTGNDGTAISNGESNAQGKHGAISNQKSSSLGGDGSTVVSDGSSTATSFKKRSVDPIIDNGLYAAPGGVRVAKSRKGEGAAVANQQSTIHAGRGGQTGIAHGDATALGGKGGAVSNQKSEVTAKGKDNTLVADGSSFASTVPQAREARYVPGGIADANQQSIAHTGAHGQAKAQGLAKANSHGGIAHASQNSIATAGFDGRADARGAAIANADYKRDVAAVSTEPKSTSDLISDAINKTTKDAAKKIISGPDTLVASSTVTAKNN